MDSKYQHLASKIQAEAAQCSRRYYLVAIAGAPGSGKTTIAQQVAEKVKRANRNVDSNVQEARSPRFVCTAIPMDGFYYLRSTLDTFTNSDEAYRRRGAPWTFDAHKVVDFVRKLRHLADDRPVWEDVAVAAGTAANGTDETERRDGDEATICAPAFSHALKDPEPDMLSISPPQSMSDTSIAIVEGNYLLLDEPPWNEMAPLMDLRVFVAVNPELARERLARRHVRASIEPTMECAYERVDSNDTINGQLVSEKLVRQVDIVIQSLHENVIY